MDFTIAPELEELRERTAAFIAASVIPTESRPREAHGPSDAFRVELQDAARAAGVFAPTVPAELGGLGLDHRGWSVILETAGYSLFGPLALNCTAPDEGNIAMLDKIATADQRERFLAPLAAGDVRSCFSMTEPRPGAGSDPTMLRTTARKTDRGWVIDGDKWCITGAEGAAFHIVMARTSEAITRGAGATMLLVDADTPGIELVSVMEATDSVSAGGHAHVRYTGVEVDDDAVLGAVGEGYRYAQVRLAPARLTHCMRWLGVARRSLDLALEYANEREVFGRRLIDQGMAQQHLADSIIDLHTSRLAIAHCAWLLDTEQDAQEASSIAKVHVSEAVNRIVDRAIQVCGSYGVLEGLPLGRYLAEVRPFRIYDGPNEAHRMSIAKRASRALRTGA
jgi:acyl-CoA dehydrogenase